MDFLCHVHRCMSHVLVILTVPRYFLFTPLPTMGQESYFTNSSVCCQPWRNIITCKYATHIRTPLPSTGSDSLRAQKKVNCKTRNIGASAKATSAAHTEHRVRAHHQTYGPLLCLLTTTYFSGLGGECLQSH